MGIYFRDILLIRISSGANNCGQHALEGKKIFHHEIFSPLSIVSFQWKVRIFVIFFERKIKKINDADLFSQTPLLIFTKGANISGGHCMSVYVYILFILYFYLFILFSKEYSTFSISKLYWHKINFLNPKPQKMISCYHSFSLNK